MKLGSLIAIGLVLALCIEGSDASKGGKDAKRGGGGGVRF
jgi:hypothetical protein